jgi:hypothetical protein
VDGITGRELLGSAFKTLSELLPDGAIELRWQPAVETAKPDSGSDAIWEIHTADSSGRLVVQAFGRFIPRDVDRVVGGNHELMRHVVRDPVLVVAPWISRRSQDMLRERGLNYLDMSGNVFLQIPRPVVYLHLRGAEQDPNPLAKKPVKLRGSGVNALVRTLVDYAPPYKLVDLARASNLSNGYVSRVLETMTDERIITRDTRNKTVVDVDWTLLLRARAESYSLFKSNRSQAFIARGGVSYLLRQIGEDKDDQAIVTGSFAAQEYVQVAAPAQLALYVPNLDAFAERYGLMPAQQGANVALLVAADASQLAGVHMREDGTVSVGLSQLVLDCLSGNGRLPEEGNALLEWMAENSSAWRGDRLPSQR